jgi:hypothetical protein
MPIGLDVRTKINKCCLGNPDAAEVEDKYKLSEHIESILFPPPPPPQRNINYADCNPASGTTSNTSYHPRFYSDRITRKAEILANMQKTNEIKQVPKQKLIIADYPTESSKYFSSEKYADVIKRSQIQINTVQKTQLKTGILNRTNHPN